MRIIKNILFMTLITSIFACGNHNKTAAPLVIEDPKGPIGVADNKNGTREDFVSPESAMANWHHENLAENNKFGVSSDKAHAQLNLTQNKEIIVAVIDSGVDIHHEDLQDKIWVNKNEIPNNGLDDDGNGYVDDVHGWNFIGGKDGRHLDGETLEETRIYKRLNTRQSSGEVLSKEEQKLLKKTKRLVETERKSLRKRIQTTQEDLKEVESHMAILKRNLDLEKIESLEQLTNIKSNVAEVLVARDALINLWNKYWRGIPGMKPSLGRAQTALNVYYNPDFNARETIVGDDPSNFSDTDYGNNDVVGPDAGHGTHVAGIIAAKRNNEIGFNGIAANVKIMVLRAVPNGDERDKDIALAVRYAADNGAHIINMSFGKKFSPYKAKVDEAFLYAANKGLLLMHAAGNSAKLINKGKNNFPNDYLSIGQGILKSKRIPNWIEVGASSHENNLRLPAIFSNYGDDILSVFAPGVKIMSTLPGNEYAAWSGTSMATPVAAGVATLLLSEFPEMTASEAKAILLETAIKPEGLKVRRPTEEKSYELPIPFKNLSQTGAVINAYSALVLAKELDKSGN